MTTERQYREELAQIGRMLHSRGMVAGTNGNVSMRLDTDEVLVSPLGVNLGRLTPEQVVLVNLDGESLAKDGKVPVEYPLHREVYRLRSDIRSVVHAHPPISTGMAAARVDMTEPLLTDLVLGFKGVPLAEYAAPTTEAFPRSISGFVSEYDAVLLANHGVLTLGQSLDDAYHKMELVESVAQASLAARLFGGGEPLSDAQAEELLGIRERLFGGARNPVCETCTDWAGSIAASPSLASGSLGSTSECTLCATCSERGEETGTSEASDGGSSGDDGERAHLVEKIAAEVLARLRQV